MFEPVCAASDLQNGGLAVRFTVVRRGETLPAFAVRSRGVARAWINQCPHVGVELDWQPGQVFDDSGLYLICATHGALFLPDSGLCLAGPCKGRSLKAVPVQERDGKIFVEQGGKDGG